EETVARGAATESAPDAAAQFSSRRGVRVHAVVAGSGRAGPAGAAPVDTRELARVASRTGGTLLLAPDAAAMERVYATIDEMEPTTFEAPRTSPPDRSPP